MITFADTGGEKPESLAMVAAMNEILTGWGWPPISVCRKVPLAKTDYTDLYGNCLSNETLPSLAFGMKSCSIKWKQIPQDQYLKGVKRGPNAAPSHPVWDQAIATGQRIVKLIGYDCGRADLRRSSKPPPADTDFDYTYPLQLLGWNRADCVQAISTKLGPHLVPVKSACFFCPASKRWELFWLAAHHPELLEHVHRDEASRTGFLKQTAQLQSEDNALDQRMPRPGPSNPQARRPDPLTGPKPPLQSRHAQCPGTQYP